MQLYTLTLLLLPIISAADILTLKPNEECSCSCKPAVAVNKSTDTVLHPITEEAKRFAKEIVGVPAKADFKPKIETSTPPVAQVPLVHSAPAPGTSVPENKTLASAIHSDQKKDLPKPADHASSLHKDSLHLSTDQIKDWKPRGTGELFGSRPHPTRTQSATVIAKVPIHKETAIPVSAIGIAELSLADIVAIAKKVWAHPKEWYTILFGSNTASYPKPTNFEELAKTKTAQLEVMTSATSTSPKPAANTVTSQATLATVGSPQTASNVVTSQPAHVTVSAHIPTANVVANQPAQTTVASLKLISNVVPIPPVQAHVEAQKPIANVLPNPAAQVHVESHSKPNVFAAMIQKRAAEVGKVDKVKHQPAAHSDIKMGSETHKLHHDAIHVVPPASPKFASHPHDSKKAVDIHQLLQGKTVGTQGPIKNRAFSFDRKLHGKYEAVSGMHPLPNAMHLAGTVPSEHRLAHDKKENPISAKIGAGKDSSKALVHHNMGKTRQRFGTF